MSGHRILVAEDNPVTQDLLKFNLERAGLVVTAASNGTSALQAATEQRFDCIVTDFQMPGMDGETLARNIRESTPNQETPIVLCSAKGFEIDKDRLQQECGVTDFLLKPFSPRLAVQLVLSLASQAAVTAAND